MVARYPLVLNTTTIQEIQTGDTVNLSLGASLPLSTGVSGTLPVGNGGTGQSSSFNQYGVTYATSTTALTTLVNGTTGQLLQANTSGAPSWVTPTYASTGKAIAMAMIFGF